jgi:hypothetical protein
MSVLRPLSELTEANLAEWYAGLTPEQRQHAAIIFVGTPKGELIARRIVESRPGVGPLDGLFVIKYDNSLLEEWRVESGTAEVMAYDFKLTVTPTKNGVPFEPHSAVGKDIELSDLATMIRETGSAAQVYFEDHPTGAEVAG